MWLGGVKKMEEKEGKKIEKVTSGSIEEIPLNEVPEEAKNLFGKNINWIEVGISPDLSTIRGYRWDGKENLEQKTGSVWRFLPATIFRCPIALAAKIEEERDRDRKKMTWGEFLSECDVSDWVFSGEEGDIISAYPEEDSDFLMLSPTSIVWGGDVVIISDEIGESWVILTEKPNADEEEGEKEYSPLHGRIFASREEADAYLQGEKE
jgi:hypothetical protein